MRPGRFAASAANIILPLLILAACAPSATTGDFDSPNPASRLYAIEQAARSGDRSAIGNLVESLDSDDPAVRLLAIATLQRLTGQTYGYRHYDPVLERREAIARWKTAMNSGEIMPIKSQPPSAPTAAATLPEPVPQR